jgi:hypothetical protein
MPRVLIFGLLEFASWPGRGGQLFVLCPNYHVLFDYVRFVINDDFSLAGLSGSLWINSKHRPPLNILLAAGECGARLNVAGNS